MNDKMKMMSLTSQEEQAKSRKAEKKKRHEAMLEEHCRQREKKNIEKANHMAELKKQAKLKNQEKQDRLAEMKKKQKEINKEKAEKANEIKRKKDIQRKKQHDDMLARHALVREEKQKNKKQRKSIEDETRKRKQLLQLTAKQSQRENEKKMQTEAIERHRREVDISFDLSCMKSLYPELSTYGEIEFIKKNIKGGLVIRYKSVTGAEKMLNAYQSGVMTRTVNIPVTHVVIKQHCLFFKPTEENNWEINEDMINEIKEYLSKISVVQQVRKMREAILVVFEDQVARDAMAERYSKETLQILNISIGYCGTGLPPAVNKKRVKSCIVPKNTKSKEKIIVKEAN